MNHAMKEIMNIIEDGAASAMTLEQIIQQETGEWRSSEKRRWMLTGDRYYRNKTDILGRERTAIGASGARELVGNLASNKLVHGFVRKLTDQKVGYLLSKPMSILTDKGDYHALLSKYFGKGMQRLLQNIGREAIVKGIAWLHVCYDEQGELSFKKIPSEEIIPLWRDAAHTQLDAVIRVYEMEAYEGMQRTTVTKVEWWDVHGVRRYVLNGGLIPDTEAGDTDSHFAVVADGEECRLNWEHVPFIAFKYNEEEQGLVELIKSLVDDYDARMSDNTNNLEDLPNSIYVVKNYGGTDGAEFRKNISTYRVVFVEGEGGVETISLAIDTDAYKTHMEMLRKDIYEFGRGVDSLDGKLGNASGVALKFRYADLDMDANIIETEFQASLEQLRWFIDAHLAATGEDNSGESVDFIFNRDIIIAESDVIANIKNSAGLVSQETLLAHHPYITNVKGELARLYAELHGGGSGQAQKYGGMSAPQLDGAGAP